MPGRMVPFHSRAVGSPAHRRYIIQDCRRQAEMYFTGNGWSRCLRDSRLYADPNVLNRTIARLTRRHFRKHLPKRLFLMTIIVRVHADEGVSRADVEQYLNKALVLGVDHERCGLGPTADSLVEVMLPPAISLEGGR